MAITLPTVLTENQSNVAGSSKATGSFAMPSTGMVLAVWSIRVNAGTLSNPTLTDNVGGTWVNYSDGTNNANSVIQSNVARIKVFRCSSFGSGTATLTLDCAGNSHDGFIWHILHYPDCLNQNAIQVVVGTGTSSALLSTLAAEQAANGTIGFGGHLSGTGAPTVGSGFTISGTAFKVTGVNLASIAEANTGNDTTVDATGSGSAAWSMIGAEVAPITNATGLGADTVRSQFRTYCAVNRRTAATAGELW